MFDRKKGFVSLWIGQGLAKKDFQHYAVEEGDLEAGPINSFAKDAKVDWYDHDFVESFCTGRKDKPIDSLLNGIDWATHSMEEILATAKGKGVSKGNSLIAMLDVELKPKRWPKRSPLYFIGTFPYEPPKPKVTAPEKNEESHGKPVVDALFSPDGTFAITNDYDDFRLWNTSNRKLIGKKKTDETFEYWLNDQTFISSCTFPESGFAQWKFRQKSLVRGKSFPTESPVYRHCLTPDKESIVWIKSRPVVGNLKKWSPQDVQDSKVVNQAHLVLPDGRIVAVDLEGVCRVWEFATGKLCNQFSLKLNARDFHGLVSDTEIAAQVPENGQQVILDVETGKLRKLKRPHRLDQGLVFQKRGNSFLIGGGGSTMKGGIRMWSLESGESISDIKIKETNVASAFAPKKGLVVTASFHGIVTIWNFETGEQLATWSVAPEGRVVETSLEDGDGHEFTCVDITSDGKKIVVGDACGRVTFLDFQRRKLKPVVG